MSNVIKRFWKLYTSIYLSTNVVSLTPRAPRTKYNIILWNKTELSETEYDSIFEVNKMTNEEV